MKEQIMKLYAVFKNGVYRQECGGVFSTLEKASAAAENFIKGERDDYHEYQIVPFELDSVTPQTPLSAHTHSDGHDYFSGGVLKEPYEIETWIRRGGVVSKEISTPLP